MTTDSYHIDTQYQGEPRRQSRAKRRRSNPLPLLAWADAQPLPMAVRYIRRLTGASPSTARLYAELAGLSINGEQGNG